MLARARIGFAVSSANQLVVHELDLGRTKAARRARLQRLRLMFDGRRRLVTSLTPHPLEERMRQDLPEVRTTRVDGSHR